MKKRVLQILNPALASKPDSTELDKYLLIIQYVHAGYQVLFLEGLKTYLLLSGVSQRLIFWNVNKAQKKKRDPLLVKKAELRNRCYGDPLNGTNWIWLSAIQSHLVIIEQAVKYLINDFSLINRRLCGTKPQFDAFLPNPHTK